MKLRKRLILASVFGAGFALSPVVFAQDSPLPSGPLPMGDITSSSARPSDSILMQKVRTVLATDTSTSQTKIDVAAKDGIVTLSGEVDSAQAKDHAQQVVARIDGVKSVNNELKVKSE